MGMRHLPPDGSGAPDESQMSPGKPALQAGAAGTIGAVWLEKRNGS